VSHPLGIHLLLDVAGVPFAILDDDVLLERLLMATVDRWGRPFWASISTASSRKG